MKLRTLIFISLIPFLFTTSCSYKEKEVSIGKTQKTIQKSQQSKQERLFGEKIKILKKKNPHEDALRAIKAGRKVIIGYFNGWETITPEFKKAPRSCKIKRISAGSDFITGKNNIQYRLVVANYARQYNLVMKKYCK